MKYFRLIVFLMILIQCYGEDRNPGSSRYCRMLGNAFKDKKCVAVNQDLEINLLAPLIGHFSRCSHPNSIQDMQGNCFVESRTDLFKIVNESIDSMSVTELNSSTISRSENFSIGTFCNDKKAIDLTNPSSYSRLIYEYNPETRSATRVIWNQDPNHDNNQEIISNRESSLKKHLVPMQLNQAVTSKWIITFTGLTGDCLNSHLPGLQQMWKTAQYQILEVVE